MRFFCHTLTIVMSTLVLISFSHLALSTTLKRNPQTPINGEQHAFVNVGKGNLTFATSDILINNRIPLEIKRVYDSSLNSTNSPLGKGWHLNLAETITPVNKQNFSYLDQNASKQQLTKREQQLVPQYPQLSEIKVARFNKQQNTIVIELKNGWRKTFKFFIDHYKLTTIRDNNANQLTLSYQDGKLKQVSASKQIHVTFYYQQSKHDSKLINQIKASTGEALTYHYQNNLLTAVNDKQWNYHYQAGKLNQILHQSDATYDFNYDQLDRIQYSDINGQQQNYQYLDHKTTVTNSLNQHYYYHQNSIGITTLASSDQQQKRLVLNPNWQIKEVYLNQQLIAKYHYNAQQQISQIHQFTQLKPDYSLTFDRSGQIIYIQSLQTNTGSSAYLYDPNGNLVSTRDQLGYAHFGYNLYGDLISSTKNHSSITFEHDTKGRIIRACTHFNGKALTVEYQYNQYGKMTTQYSDLIAERIFTALNHSLPNASLNPIATAQYQLSAKAQILTITHNFQQMMQNTSSTDIAWRSR